MLRRTPMKRGKGFKSKRHDAPAVPREDRPMALYPASRRGTYGGTLGEAAPKTRARRNPTVLEMARGRACLIRRPGVCVGLTETTVAAHSNLLEHGKGKSRKADDCYTVWACFPCHAWLDQGGASAQEKEAAFRAALQRQADQWRAIAGDASEPPRFRAAAQWALDQLDENKEQK
jgi:hypothetical protein